MLQTERAESLFLLARDWRAMTGFDRVGESRLRVPRAPLADLQAIVAPHLIAALSVLIMFGLLATTVATGSAEKLDFMVRSIVHGARVARANRLYEGSNKSRFSGNHCGILSLGAALVGFWLAGDPGSVSLSAWTMGAAIILENGIKFAFQRPRPEPFFNIMAPKMFNFPSGHAAGAGIIIWATAVVALIGFSRIYLGSLSHRCSRRLFGRRLLPLGRPMVAPCAKSAAQTEVIGTWLWDEKIPTARRCAAYCQGGGHAQF
jgi:membrane-associated phospholipid phosphatase